MGGRVGADLQLVPSTAIAATPPPQCTDVCVHAAPSVEAKRLVDPPRRGPRRWRAPRARRRAARPRPRRAAPASPRGGPRTGRRSKVRGPVSGGRLDRRERAAGAGGLRLRRWRSPAPAPPRRPSRVSARVAAKPQPPPDRTRTPMPSSASWEASSTAPLRTASVSRRRERGGPPRSRRVRRRRPSGRRAARAQCARLERGRVDRAQLVAVGGGRRVGQLGALRGGVGAAVQDGVVDAEGGEVRGAGEGRQALGQLEVGDELVAAVRRARASCGAASPRWPGRGRRRRPARASGTSRGAGRTRLASIA